MSTSADTRQRVLVVDDDKAVRESLRRSLEYNGYDVVLASGTGVHHAGWRADLAAHLPADLRTR